MSDLDFERVLLPLFTSEQQPVAACLLACCEDPEDVLRSLDVRPYSKVEATLLDDGTSPMRECLKRMEVHLFNKCVTGTVERKIVLISNLMDTIRIHRNTVARELGALHRTMACKPLAARVFTIYALDMRDPEVRRMIRKRDILKNLGPTVYVGPDRKLCIEPGRAGNNAEVVRLLNRLDADYSSGPTDAVDSASCEAEDPYIFYENLSELAQPKAPQSAAEPWMRVIEQFLACSVIDKTSFIMSQSTIKDTTSDLVDTIQELLVRSFPHALNAKHRCSQTLTRCGMYVNQQKQLARLAQERHQSVDAFLSHSRETSHREVEAHLWAPLLSKRKNALFPKGSGA
jgi:hypothetical protein